MIAPMVVILGLLAAQNDSASSNPPDEPIEADAGYVYMNFNADAEGDGLLSFYRDPATRGSVVRYLDQAVGDEVLADALLEAADLYSIDPALVVALAWQESKFNPRAQGQNRNGTTDRGLMQLNSSSFAGYSPEELFSPGLNAMLGTAYLRDSLDKAGNTVAALAMYNAGPNRVSLIGAPRSTLDYISNIMGYRDDLIQSFRESVLTGGVLMTRDIKPVKNPDFL